MTISWTARVVYGRSETIEELAWMEDALWHSRDFFHQGEDWNFRCWWCSLLYFVVNRYALGQFDFFYCHFSDLDTTASVSSTLFYCPYLVRKLTGNSQSESNGVWFETFHLARSFATFHVELRNFLVVVYKKMFFFKQFAATHKLLPKPKKPIFESKRKLIWKWPVNKIICKQSLAMTLILCCLQYALPQNSSFIGIISDIGL